MRASQVILLITLLLGCQPVLHGIYQELPIPTGPVARFDERHARELLNEGGEAMGAREWATAEQRFLQALTIRRTIFAPESLQIAECKLRLSRAMLQQGHFNRALPLLSSVRSAILADRSENPETRAEIAFDTALVFSRIGHAAYADEMFREAHKISSLMLGVNHINTQIIEFWLSGQCGIEDRSSFNEDRLRIFITRLTARIDENKMAGGFAERHQRISFCTWMRAHHVLAQRLIKRGDRERLFKLLEDGENAARRWFEKCSPFADYLEMEGTLFASIGEADRAARAYDKAISLILAIGRPCDGLDEYRNKWRKKRSDFRLAGLLQGRSQVYILTRDFAAAEQTLREAIGLLTDQRTDLPATEGTLGEVLEILANLAEVRWLRGNHQHALVTWMNALALFETRFRALAMGQSESWLLTQLDSLRRIANVVHSLLSSGVTGPDRDGLQEIALAVALLRQGRATEEIASQFAPYYPQMSDHMHELKSKLIQVRMQYSALEYQGENLANHESHYRQKLDLLAQADSIIISILSGLNPGDKNFDFPSSREIANRVKERLLPGSALVEFVRYDHQAIPSFAGQRASANRYAALVLRGDGKLVVHDIGDESRINRNLQRLRIAMTEEKRIYDDVPAIDAYELLIAPLEEYLQDVKHIYMIPDGALQLVPFSILSNGDDLFGEKYAIRYLSSGRDLLRTQKKQVATDVVVFANPDIDAVPDAEAVPTATFAPAEPYATSRTMSLRRTPHGLDLRGFGPLKYAEEEAWDIKEIFDMAEAYTGSKASEKRLTDLATAPGILHIASHGLFLGDTESSGGSGSRGFLAREYDSPPANPLLRSMLLMAGARRGRTSPDSAYDGLATALELSGLPLKGTQMVVLSACESGLGELTEGEGVAGLRRAFLVAGAETVVASLWKVDDAVTRELMQAFYRYLKQGEGRAEAMQHASSDIRETHPHPYYWASFVVIGEGGPLRGMTN